MVQMLHSSSIDHSVFCCCEMNNLILDFRFKSNSRLCGFPPQPFNSINSACVTQVYNPAVVFALICVSSCLHGKVNTFIRERGIQ